jgi:hypothetical protein
MVRFSNHDARLQYAASPFDRLRVAKERVVLMLETAFALTYPRVTVRFSNRDAGSAGAPLLRCVALRQAQGDAGG